MPITLNCSCGKTLRVADEHAGKRVKCPACNAIIASTPPAPQFEVIEDEPKQTATSPRPVAKPVVNPRDDDDDTDSYGLTAAERTPNPPATKPAFRRRADSDEDDDDDRPRRRRRGTSRAAGAASGADAGKRIAYILGGGVMIPVGIGLAIWGNSGEGRGATRLLIFGICVAIGGLITLVRGITGNISDED